MSNVRLLSAVTALCIGWLCSDVHGQTSGGCCLTDAQCLELPGVLCDALMGVYLGDDSTCQAEACLGACVFEKACVDDFDAADCLTEGGEWLGSGSDCEATPLIAACCIGVNECLDLTQAACFKQGGNWLVGSSCEFESCAPLGACCVYETGECIDQTTFEDCVVKAKFGTGEWQGGDSTCAETACPIFGFGACCYESFCESFAEEGTCGATGGTYMGDNTPCTHCCPGDIDGSGLVGVSDLLNLLGDWDPCQGNPFPCPADLTFDGKVDSADLLVLLENWNNTCDF